MSDPNRSFLLPDARDLERVAAHVGEAVARLLLEAPRCHAPDPFGPPARPNARRLRIRAARGERLPPRLTVVPVKGYGTERAAVEDAMREVAVRPAAEGFTRPRRRRPS